MRLNKIDPEEYFKDWAFPIRQFAWPALGIVLREYVDREKTKPLREAALKAGVPKSRILHVKSSYFAYAHANPPQFDFHPGDIFYTGSGAEAIQVIGLTKDSKIEVHHLIQKSTMLRDAHHLSPALLAEWLRSGMRPQGTQISADQSVSETLRYMISNVQTSSRKQMQLDL